MQKQKANPEELGFYLMHHKSPRRLAVVECHTRPFLHRQVRALHRQLLPCQTILFCRDARTSAMNQPIDTKKQMQAVLTDQVVFRLDLDGNILSVNEAAERLTGYSAVELARLNVLDLLPGQCAADLHAMANRSIRNRFGPVFEIEVTTRDRRQFPVEVSIDLIRRPDRKLEFHGIAVLKNDDAASHLRPRCLDIRFQFKASTQLNAVLQAAW